MTLMTDFGGGDLQDDMVTQHNKVAAATFYQLLLMICMLIVTLLAGTNLSFIAPFIAGSIWTVAGSILS